MTVNKDYSRYVPQGYTEEQRDQRTWEKISR